MTIDEAWPGFGRPFTVAELDRMPSDGHRYELMEGALVVSPRPTTVHLAVTGRLIGVLSTVCPAELCLVLEPAVQLDRVTELAPDLYVLEATSTQPLTVSRPFTVSIAPADLTRGLLR